MRVGLLEAYKFDAFGGYECLGGLERGKAMRVVGYSAGL